MHRRTGEASEKPGSASEGPKGTGAPLEGTSGLSAPCLERCLELIPNGPLLGGHGGRTSRRLQGAWDHGEATPGHRDGRLTSMGVDRAQTLAQLGLDLPDGVLQPLQQELKDGGETVGLHLGNILEGDLASIEVVNYVHHGHTSLLPL